LLVRPTRLLPIGSSHHTGANRQAGKTRAACRRWDTASAACRRKRRLPPLLAALPEKGRTVCQ